MHIFLDRTLCNRKVGCEMCFATHLASADFEDAMCIKHVETDERPEYVFRIEDRDQSIKTLVVNKENLNEALASWIWLWERQAGPVI